MDDDANMKESKIMSEYIKTQEMIFKVEIEKELADYAQEYYDKHWEECRQIALYDDELKKAMNLLKEVGNIHAAALRENSYETRILSGKLMQQVRALETEIRLSEVQK